LGAWNAATNAVVSITTDATVNAETMCDLLRMVAALALKGPIRLVLDNARYQHCAGDGPGQKLEHRIAVLARVFAEPESD
jgi:hypothetical protein